MMTHTTIWKRNPYLIHKAFYSYFAASVLASIATTMGVVVDGVIVSNLIGKDALSAINLSMPLVQLATTFYLLLNVGGAICAAMAMGRGKSLEAKSYFTFSMICSLALGLLFTCCGLFFSEGVSEILCADPALRPLVYNYATILLYSAPIYILMPGLGVFVRTDGSPKLVSIALVGANIINLLLDIVFIKYVGMGIEGSSLATSIGFACGIGIMTLHFRKKERLIGWRLPKSSEISFGAVLTYGLPMALASIFMTVRLFGMNHIVLEYLGLVGICILSVSFNMLMIVNMVVSGTVQAMQPIGAVLLGMDDRLGVRTVIYKALRTLLIFITVLVVFLSIMPEVIMGLFGITDPQTLSQADSALRIVALSFLPFGFTYLLMTVYQLHQHSKLAIFTSIAQSIAVVPIMYLFVRTDESLVWWSFLAGELLVLGLIVLLTHFIRSKDRTLSPLTLLKKTVGEKILEFSVGYTEEQLSVMNEQIGQFMAENEVEEAARNRVELCCEELVLNIIRHGHKTVKRRFVDIRVLIADGAVNVCIQDDGVFFNPIEDDPRSGLGLLIVKGGCRDLQYKRVFNQNVTVFNVDY